MSKKSSTETEPTEAETAVVETSVDSESSVSQSGSETENKTESSETSEKNEQSSSATEKTSSQKKPKRCGLARFLQLHPQSYYIVALLKPYSMSVMTEDEWEATIKTILERKVNH